jgi:hypothetical protein
MDKENLERLQEKIADDAARTLIESYCAPRDKIIGDGWSSEWYGTVNADFQQSVDEAIQYLDARKRLLWNTEGQVVMVRVDFENFDKQSLPEKPTVEDVFRDWLRRNPIPNPTHSVEFKFVMWAKDAFAAGNAYRPEVIDPNEKQMIDIAAAMREIDNTVRILEPGEEVQNPWLDAIDKEMSDLHMNIRKNADGSDDIKTTLDDLIGWHVQVATNPEVSEEARKLIKRGESRMRGEIENFRVWLAKQMGKCDTNQMPVAIQTPFFVFGDVLEKFNQMLLGRAIPDGSFDMILHCPNCGNQHIDAPDDQYYGGGTTAEGFEPRWDNPPHKTHCCEICNHEWRPADFPTNGVAEIHTATDATRMPPKILPLDSKRLAFFLDTVEKFTEIESHVGQTREIKASIRFELPMDFEWKPNQQFIDKIDAAMAWVEKSNSLDKE